MHWLDYNDAVSWRKFSLQAILKISKFTCILFACQPACRNWPIWQAISFKIKHIEIYNINKEKATSEDLGCTYEVLGCTLRMKFALDVCPKSSDVAFSFYITYFYMFNFETDGLP